MTPKGVTVPSLRVDAFPAELIVGAPCGGTPWLNNNQLATEEVTGGRRA
jgi:hypothetical protein